VNNRVPTQQTQHNDGGNSFNNYNYRQNNNDNNATPAIARRSANPRNR